MQQEVSSSRSAKIGFLAVCATFVIAYNVHVISFPQPEERYLVQVLSVAFGGAVVLEILSLLRATPDTPGPSERGTLRDSVVWLKSRTGSLMVGIAFYIILIPVLGFFVASGLFLLAQSLFLGVRSALPIILVEVFCLGATYFLLAVALGAQLPSGLLM